MMTAMKRYVLTVSGTVREQYVVEADDEQSARFAFESGQRPVTKPVVSEVTDAEVIDVTELPALD